MLGDREADAENVDELEERRHEIPEADQASFYPDAGAYPSGGEMPPTGEMGDPSPSDALQPEPETLPEEEEAEPGP